MNIKVFVIGKIKSIDNDVASIDIGIDIKTNIDVTQYNKDDYVVIALPNVILANGKITKDYKIINSVELGFEESKVDDVTIIFKKSFTSLKKILKSCLNFNGKIY